ncbi:MAG TPA: hypothetical protein VF412_18010 [Bdellovibrio sp.]|uniref:hypothetical protein n=1 Tax=Bdellovibrio sp. TaxID=28201 RepID=UPI002EDBE3F9
MKQLIKKHSLLVTTTVLFVLIALIYIAITPKVYVAGSRVAIFRMKIENPENASDESRNRWIWIRDGLNINSALVSDEQLKKFLETNDLAKKATQAISSEVGKLNFLRRLTNVQFTGADENNYVIETKSSDPQLALALNAHIFGYLKFLAVQKDNDDFQALANKVAQEADTYPERSQERAFYQNKLMKMKFEHVIGQSQKERVFQVISEPSVGDKAVWPKPLAILLVAVLAGLVIGFVAEYLIFAFKSK